jgi:hypothetical protein
MTALICGPVSSSLGQRDLKTQVSIFEKYPHSRFLRELPADSEFFPIRDRIADLFQYLDGLEDRHFESQIDREPYARLWEMMLAKMLKTQGHQPASAARGPDFVFEHRGQRIFIEAICPGPGDDDNPNSVPPLMHGAPIAQEVPVAQIVLRICSALEEKKRKFARYLEQGVVSQDDVTIIAISSSRIGVQASGLWPPVIMRATHGLGNPYVVFDKDEGAVGEGIGSNERIPKVSGHEIETTFLLSDSNNAVSAVLYSECSVFSMLFDLYVESMLIHNPSARVCLRPGLLPRMKELWTICCSDTKYWRAYEIAKTRETR